MKQYYTAYRARSMCPTCSQETEVFITNQGIPTYDPTKHDYS